MKSKKVIAALCAAAVVLTSAGGLPIGTELTLFEPIAASAADTTDYTIDMAQQGFSNASEVASVQDSNNIVTVTFDKGTNSSNAPKYYSSGNAMRLYGGNSMTVSADSEITSIEITFGSGENSNSITAGTGTFSNNTWTGDAKSVTFTIGGTSGHRRIKSLKVTVKKEASAANSSAEFDFSNSSFRENIGTDLIDKNGWICNESFAIDGTSLQITGGVLPSRVYNDNNRGQALVFYNYSSLIFKAPEGKAITKIEFLAAGNSNINRVTASSGVISGMDWTGNAEGVRFAQSGTTYLSKAIVTLKDKDNDTAALPAISYTECDNIAAFNALSADTYAKVSLQDAEIIGISADDYTTAWIQDASGGCMIEYSSLMSDRLHESTKINGFIYARKNTKNGNSFIKETEDTPRSEFTSTSIDGYTIAEGTIADVNVASNLNKVVKISNATFTATNISRGKLSQGDVTIDVDNGTATATSQLHKIAQDWENGETDTVTMIAILTGKSTSVNQLLPISMVSAAQAADPAFTVTIPAEVTLGNTAAVSVSDVANIPNRKNLVVTISGSGTNGAFEVENSGDSLNYTVTKDSTNIAAGGTIISTTTAVNAILTFNAPTAEPRYAGEYKGTVTFNVSIS